MNTYTVNVNVGTTIQVIISAEDEDEAEIIASKEVEKIISDTENASIMQSNIDVIDAEVVDEIQNITLENIVEFKKENNES